MDNITDKKSDVNERALRELTEIAESIDKNIIKRFGEDRAMMLYAYDGINGQAFVEKYRLLIEDLTELNDEVFCTMEEITLKAKRRLTT